MNELLPPACVEPDRFLVELAFEETSNVPPEVRTHISGCDRCTRALKELQETRSLAALPLEEPSAAMDDNILAALDAHLAGDKVDTFVKLPDPERALGAERLFRHLSQPPRARVEAAPAMAAPAPVERTAPRPVRARRRWTAGFAAAASVVVVIGGALYLRQNTDVSLAAREPAAEVAEAQEETALRDEALAKDRAQILQKNEEAKPLAPPPVAAAPAAKPDAMKLEAEHPGDRRRKQDAPVDRLQAARKDAAPERQEARNTGMNFFESATGSAAAGGGASAEKKKAYRQDSADAPKEQPATPPPPPAAVAAPTAAPTPMPAPSMDRAPPSTAGLVAEAPKVAKKLSMSQDRSGESRAMADSDSEAAAPPWSDALSRARAATARHDQSAAAKAWGDVLAVGGLPSNVEQEALKGQLDALLALHRFDEAQALADRLASKFPAQAAARARVLDAKSKAEATTLPAAEAAPAEAAEKK